MSSGIGRASKAKKKLERLGYVEGEEMTMEAFDNIWHSYNGNKFALPDSEARKFLKDFWAARNLPWDQDEADELMDILEPIGTDNLSYSYDQFRALFWQVATSYNVGLSTPLSEKLRKRVYGPSVEVFLNVYDLFDLGKVNDRTIHLGFGAFHSAVEVFGIEFAFGYPAGVYTISPRMSSIGRFREAISMGVAAMVVEDLKDVIRELQTEFLPEEYNISTNNCHTFSDELCMRLVHHHIPPFLNNLPKFIKYFKPFIPEDVLTFKDRGDEADPESESYSPRTQSGPRFKRKPKGLSIAKSSKGQDSEEDSEEYIAYSRTGIPDDMKEEMGLIFAAPKTSEVVKKLTMKNQEKRNLQVPLSRDELGQDLPDEAAKNEFGRVLSDPNTSDVMKKLAQKNREKKERARERPKSQGYGLQAERSSRADPPKTIGQVVSEPSSGEKKTRKNKDKQIGSRYDEKKEQNIESPPRIHIPDDVKEEIGFALTEPNTSDVMRKLAQKNAERAARSHSSDIQQNTALPNPQPQKKDRSISPRERLQTITSPSGRARSRSGGLASSHLPSLEYVPRLQRPEEAKEELSQNLSEPNTSYVLKKLAQKNKEKRDRAQRFASSDSRAPQSPTFEINLDSSPIHEPMLYCSQLVQIPEEAKAELIQNLSEPNTNDVVKKLAQKNKEKREREAQALANSAVGITHLSLSQELESSLEPHISLESMLYVYSPGVRIPEEAKDELSRSLSDPNTNDVVKKLAQKNKEKREREVSLSTISEVATQPSSSGGLISTGYPSPESMPYFDSPQAGSVISTTASQTPSLQDSSNSLPSPDTSSVVLKLSEKNREKRQNQKAAQILGEKSDSLPRMRTTPSSTSRGSSISPTRQSPALSPTQANSKILEELSNSLICPDSTHILEKLSNKNKTQSMATAQLLEQVIGHVEEQVDLLSTLLQQLREIKENSVRAPASEEASAESTEPITPRASTPLTASTEISRPTNLYQSAEEHHHSQLLFQSQQHVSQIAATIIQAEIQSLKNKLGRENAKTQANTALESVHLLQKALKQLSDGPKRFPLNISHGSSPELPQGCGRKSPKSGKSLRKKRAYAETEDRGLDDNFFKLFRSRRTTLAKREAKYLQPLEKDALRLSMRLDGVDLDEVFSKLPTDVKF